MVCDPLKHLRHNFILPKVSKPIWLPQFAVIYWAYRGHAGRKLI